MPHKSAVLQELDELFTDSESQSIKVEGTSLDAKRIEIDFDEGGRIIEQSIFYVVRSGGHLCLAERKRDGVTRAPSYSLLWFSECRFEEQLALIGQLSFFGDQETYPLTSELRKTIVTEVRDFLKRFSETQEIAITEYHASTVVVRQIGKEAGVWDELMKTAIAFNEQLSGRKYDRNEYRGYLEQFRKFRFFVVSG